MCVWVLVQCGLAASSGNKRVNVGNGVQQTQGHSAVCLCRGRSGDDDDCFKGQNQVKDGNTDDDDGDKRAIGLVGFWNRGTKGGEREGEREGEATGESETQQLMVQGQTDAGHATKDIGGNGPSASASASASASTWRHFPAISSRHSSRGRPDCAEHRRTPPHGRAGIY